MLATLVVGIEPEGVAASPDRRWVYVTAETSNTVSVIYARANRVVANILADLRPRAAAFSPDGARAYVTNEVSGTLLVVDTGARTRCCAAWSWSAERGSRWASSSRPTAHGCPWRTAWLRWSRCWTRARCGRSPASPSPAARAGSPSRDGRRVYAACGLADEVDVVDTATHRVVARIPVGRRPRGVAITR